MGSRFIKEGQLIYLKSPDFNELDEVAKLWSDEATMKEVGGTVVFKKERYQDWYQRMINPGDGKNHYCLIYNNQNKVVGEVSFHRFNSDEKSAEFNIKIYDSQRGNGYAKEATFLMLDYYFNEFGGESMLDEVINIKGQQALIKFGFEEVKVTEQGVLFRMTKTNFQRLIG